jgi:hypothetical protein
MQSNSQGKLGWFAIPPAGQHWEVVMRPLLPCPPPLSPLCPRRPSAGTATPTPSATLTGTPSASPSQTGSPSSSGVPGPSELGFPRMPPPPMVVVTFGGWIRAVPPACATHAGVQGSSLGTTPIPHPPPPCPPRWVPGLGWKVQPAASRVPISVFFLA